MYCAAKEYIFLKPFRGIYKENMKLFTVSMEHKKNRPKRAVYICIKLLSSRDQDVPSTTQPDAYFFSDLRDSIQEPGITMSMLTTSATVPEMLPLL